jgi:4'-phosphopantetheinyl transferase
LNRHEVHLWRIELDLAPPALAAMRGLLASDELERASRFRFEPDRDRFIAARGAMRLLLGRYLGSDPSGIAIEYEPFGKPVIRPTGVMTRLSFNLSHAHALAIMAVTADRQIGVDVEKVVTVPDLSDLVQSCLSAEEVAEWEELPASERLMGFFRFWTSKEALSKAIGVGLSRPLDLVTTSFHGGNARYLAGTHPAPDGPEYGLFVWEPAEGFVSAVAVESVARAPLRYVIRETV